MIFPTRKWVEDAIRRRSSAHRPRVDRLQPAAERALLATGLAVECVQANPGFARLIVSGHLRRARFYDKRSVGSSRSLRRNIVDGRAYLGLPCRYI